MQHSRNFENVASTMGRGQSCLRTEMGVFALAVDAKDEASAAFYPHFGFVAFASKPLQLFLPLATIAET